MRKNTLVIKLDKENIKLDELKIPSEILKSGGLVAFPTETVYGLGANALDEDAVKSIFVAKGRPSDNPLIVHISDISQLENLVKCISESAKKLMEKFWPGPLTLLFEKSDLVPLVTSGGLDTIAVRMPDNEVALSIIKQTGLPIAAPSANLSGRPSPTSASHVLEDLDGKIDAVVDGGETSVGLESTVLDLTSDTPLILRPGSVTREQLLEVLKEVSYDSALESSDKRSVPKSPGQKYRHYSPKAKMEIFLGKREDVVDKINEELKKYDSQGIKTAVLSSDETLDLYNARYKLSMGSEKELSKVASNLFHLLREFDKLDVDIILSEGVEEVGIGKAIMNRLKKAAGGNVTYV